jgi:hypothetical protein
LILASVLALIFGGLSDFCPLQIGSANCLLFALGLKFRHSMDSFVLRRLQPTNQCYGNLTWEITQMFVEGPLQSAEVSKDVNKVMARFVRHEPDSGRNLATFAGAGQASQGRM